MSSVEESESIERSGSDAFDSWSAKKLGRSMLEMEVRIKQEFKNQKELNGSGTAKMLAEFNKVQHNVTKVLSLMEQNDATIQEKLQDMAGKISKISSGLDKSIRDQELLRKKLDAIERSQKSEDQYGRARMMQRNFLPNHIGPRGVAKVGPMPQVPGARFNHKFIANRNPVSQQMAPNDEHAAAENPKTWTSRGDGKFTSDESDTEQESSDETTDEKTVVSQVSKEKLLVRDVSKSGVKMGSLAKILYSRASSETSLEVEEVCYMLDNDEKEDGEITLETTKNEDDEVAIFSDDQGSSILVNSKVEIFSETLEIVQQSASESKSAPDVNEKEVVIIESKTTEDKISEASRASVSSPQLVPDTNASPSLVGGFGNFRRGKPPAITQPAKKASSSDEKGKTADDENGASNEIGEIISRPLTPDELRVLALTEKTSKPGASFGKPCGAMLPAMALGGSRSSSFAGGSSYSSPSGPRNFSSANVRRDQEGSPRTGSGSKFGSNSKKAQQPGRNFQL